MGQFRNAELDIIWFGEIIKYFKIMFGLVTKKYFTYRTSKYLLKLTIQVKQYLSHNILVSIPYRKINIDQNIIYPYFPHCNYSLDRNFSKYNQRMSLKIIHRTKYRYT